MVIPRSWEGSLHLFWGCSWEKLANGGARRSKRGRNLPKCRTPTSSAVRQPLLRKSWGWGGCWGTTPDGQRRNLKQARTETGGEAMGCLSLQKCLQLYSLVLEPARTLRDVLHVQALVGPWKKLLAWADVTLWLDKQQLSDPVTRPFSQKGRKMQHSPKRGICQCIILSEIKLHQGELMEQSKIFRNKSPCVIFVELLTIPSLC